VPIRYIIIIINIFVITIIINVIILLLLSIIIIIIISITDYYYYFFSFFFFCFFFLLPFLNRAQFCLSSVEINQCCVIDSPSSSSGLASGAIAGIVLGTLCCVGVCVAFLIFLMRKRSPAPLVRAVELHPLPVPAAGVEGEPFDCKAVHEGQSSSYTPHLPTYEEAQSFAAQVEICEGTPSDPFAGEANQVNIAQAPPVFAHIAWQP
jgi:hypothetical protein